MSICQSQNCEQKERKAHGVFVHIHLWTEIVGESYEQAIVLDSLAVIKTLGSGGRCSSYAPTNSFFSLGSYSTMYPATALAATVKGDARYICPGPLRPGKLRFCALITT